MSTSLFNQIFRDSSGKIVIGQMPNLPIIIWAVASLLKIIFTQSNVYVMLDILATVSLIFWAGQEIFQGVNYFRRGLGCVVLACTIAAKINW